MMDAVLQVFDPGYFAAFSPANRFVKWAACEVTQLEIIPDGMQPFLLNEGLYAVFDFKGPVSAAPAIFGYIYQEWLSGSDYQLDDRPHFEKLGEKYKNDAPDSEEEIWIPVRSKV